MYILQFLCTYYSSDVHTLFLFSYYIYKYFYFYCMLFYIFTTLLPYARGLQRKFHWLTCECPMIIKTLESWILNIWKYLNAQSTCHSQVTTLSNAPSTAVVTKTPAELRQNMVGDACSCLLRTVRTDQSQQTVPFGRRVLKRQTLKHRFQPEGE